MRILIAAALLFLSAIALVPACAEAAEIPQSMRKDLHLLPVSERQVICLALTVYHEARAEPYEGRLAVAQVVLNRVADQRFPRTICDVVRQGPSGKKLSLCQFSWSCDGASDSPLNLSAWRKAVQVAKVALRGAVDRTGGALWYHADSVKPVWTLSLVETKRVGRHRFYVDAGPTFTVAGVD